jgi:hypothetical protein
MPGHHPNHETRDQTTSKQTNSEHEPAHQRPAEAQNTHASPLEDQPRQSHTTSMIDTLISGTRSRIAPVTWRSFRSATLSASSRASLISRRMSSAPFPPQLAHHAFQIGYSSFQWKLARVLDGRTWSATKRTCRAVDEDQFGVDLYRLTQRVDSEESETEASKRPDSATEDEPESDRVICHGRIVACCVSAP